MKMFYSVSDEFIYDKRPFERPERIHKLDILSPSDYGIEIPPSDPVYGQCQPWLSTCEIREDGLYVIRLGVRTESMPLAIGGVHPVKIIPGEKRYGRRYKISEFDFVYDKLALKRPLTGEILLAETGWNPYMNRFRDVIEFSFMNFMNGKLIGIFDCAAALIRSGRKPTPPLKLPPSPMDDRPDWDDAPQWLKGLGKNTASI